jgi:hypothetical protein
MGYIETKGLVLAPQVKQRVFYGRETPAKVLILNGLLKTLGRRQEPAGNWLPIVDAFLTFVALTAARDPSGLRVFQQIQQLAGI